MTDTQPFVRVCLALLLSGMAGCSMMPAKHAPLPDNGKAALEAELASIKASIKTNTEAQQKQRSTGGSGAADKDAAHGMLPPQTTYLPVLASEAKEPHFDLVVDNAPAQQVFLSMVSGTRYSIMVHPEVTGVISVDLKETTVPEALDVLRDLYGYEYTIRGSRIVVQSGRLQTRVFNVNYLSLKRDGKSDVRVTSGSLTTPTGGAGSNGSTPSTGATTTPGGATTTSAQESSRVTTTMQGDMWQDLAGTLKMIVGSGEGRQVIVSSPTGTVAVRAMPQELTAVAQYLKTLGVNVGRQVMLEAKIIDVQLSDSQQEGINWAAFHVGGNSRLSIGEITPGTLLQKNGGLATGGTGFDSTGAVLNPTLAAIPGADLIADARAAGGLLGLAFQTSNFAALLNFLETQGKVQVLSSPRIATINNQKAVLKVGTDDFFVTNISTTTTQSAGNNTTSPSITVQPFFSGVALDVTPQIDEHDNVTLHVHPQVSAVTEKDKIVNLGSAGVYTLPLASSSVSETDSIVRIANSNIAAIGGLMTRTDSIVRSAVPGIGDVPVLGRLFRQNATSTTKRELVILIKPTVIHEESDWAPITTEDTARLRLSSELRLDRGGN